MRNQATEALKSVINKTGNCRSWHLSGKRLLNKLENWCELLGNWYGTIFPQEHPGLDMTLGPVSVKKYQSRRNYHRPDKCNHILERSKGRI